MEKSRQKPKERIDVLHNVGSISFTDTIPMSYVIWFLHLNNGLLWQALRTNNYNADPLLRSFGISIDNQFIEVRGRVLPTPNVSG